ncbi:MAG TPA: hypothetical protein VFO16_05610, partial [Pseudonocardiaceae bacterium]|nr:hypothetical protein [Pseudonocardiaceae bacterium]
MRSLRRVWATRPLPVRVAVVVMLAGLVLFLLLAKASAAVVARTLTDGLDSDLAAAVGAAAPAVSEGRPVPRLPGPTTRVRVLNRAGAPLDGGGPVPLSARDVSRLLAGQPVWTSQAPPNAALSPTRWSGRVVSAPDGTPRLVVAGAESLAHASLIARTTAVL